MTRVDATTRPDKRAIGVVVIEDHALLAHTLTLSLHNAGYRAQSLVPLEDPDFLDTVAELQPDVVLLDLDLGDLGSSISLIPTLRAGGTKVVVLTGETSRARWGECIEAGADAVLSKVASFDELLERISRNIEECDDVARAEQEELRACAREHRRNEKARRECFERLTPRESDILRALMQGMSAEEIASDSFISLTTVRTHIRSILVKLEVNSQLAAVAAAVRCGWR